jgi:hypothetical protein
VLERLREVGIIEARERDGSEWIEGPDLEVLAAIANLARLGFTEEAGFSADDLALYRRSIEALVQMESRDVPRETSGSARGEPIPWRWRGARSRRHVAIVALRKKRIADVLALLGKVDGPKDRRRSKKARSRAVPSSRTKRRLRKE